MVSRRRAFALSLACVVLTAVLAVSATIYVIYTGPLGRIYGIVNLLDRNFYKPVDRAKVLEGAARGVVATLGDPYSVFMNAQEWQEFDINTSGEYSGIGVTIDVKDSRVQIAPPMKGTPAEEAGLLGGDVILKVDGVAISSNVVAASLIRGPAGTKVTLTIGRGLEMFDVTLTRKEISIPSLAYEMKEGGIGYIELLAFNEHSAAETAAALADLKSQGTEAIILDLRYNGGGYVDQCRLIGELFVPKGVFVTLKYKNLPSEAYETSGSGLGMPLFVLVNRGSASASEILAGAVQDRKAGILIGEQTFAKGLVQGSFALRDGSVIKLTIAEYLTPNGKAINGEGLEPDVKVAGDEAQMAKALELAREAIRKGA